MMVQSQLVLRRKPVVLIAEDNGDIRELTKLLLELEGCRVIEAADGDDAVHAACSLLPDLILVDMQMPVMDGVEVTRRLRRYHDTRHIPIIALSASRDRQREALDAGCSEFLAKPLMSHLVQELLAKLHITMRVSREFSY
jgi:CheY-like chemotaxis protein